MPSTFALVLCAVLCACIGITPMPKRTRTAYGSTPNLDLKFVKPGQTTRAEVLQKLGATDSGFRSRRYFLGRYSVSKYGGWLVLSLNDDALQSAGRNWREYNLLIEFDEHDIVKSQQIFPDSKLIATLTPVAAEVKLEREQIKDVLWNYILPGIPLELNLTDAAIEVREQEGKRPRHYVVPSSIFTRVTRSLQAPSDTLYTNVVLHFSRNLKTFGGPSSRDLRLRLTVPQLIDILAYLSAHNPNAAISR